MKRIVLGLLLCTSAAVGAAHAQGLIGAPSCPRSASEPAPLIQGKDDSERWLRFQGIQSSLIGMSYDQVVRALGQGKAFIKSDEFRLKPDSKQDRSCLLYEIAKTKISGKAAPMELTIVFKDNCVQSYIVETVF